MTDYFVRTEDLSMFIPIFSYILLPCNYFYNQTTTNYKSTNLKDLSHERQTSYSRFSQIAASLYPFRIYANLNSKEYIQSSSTNSG